MKKEFVADEIIAEYIEHLLEYKCLQPEEEAYLTDDKNYAEIKELYLHVRDLMFEPVDKTYKDSCLVGDFLDFDEVFSIELFNRTMNYTVYRYAEHDLNLVNGKYTDTDMKNSEYINRIMYDYIKNQDNT